MKRFRLSFLIAVLLCMSANSLSAHDIEVKNADGVIIYYNYISDDGTQLGVTFRGSSYDDYNSNDYTGNIVIPEEVTYMNKTCKVTHIGRDAFHACSDLTSVIIPNSVTYIGGGAFYDCSKLTSVTIGNSVTSIGVLAFGRCSSLTSVIIPSSVTSIEGGAFSGCNNLLSVTLNSNNIVSVDRKIETSLWHYFGTQVTNYFIGDDVKRIGKYAFCGCSSLVSITIPNSVKRIESQAFYKCSSLTSAIIGDCVTDVDSEAFYDCSNLTTLTIGISAKYIYNRVFKGCDKLTSVTIRQVSPPIYGISLDAFSNHKNATLYVPIGSASAYKIAYVWRDFKNIVELDIPIPTHKLTYCVDGENYRIYDIKVGATITPEPAPTKEGYTFSGWSEIPATMPAHDITVTGTFAINKYKMIYNVDGEEYKSYELDYGVTITSEPAPTKDGYTFSGWSEIPETMPAHDVTVTGTFTINKYKLTYIVDGQTCKTYDVEYGSAITPEAEPMKEGYTFSGWSEIPETMPAHDVTVTGTFTINKYKLTYIIDGNEYKSYELDYGASITPEVDPTKEGYTFLGWSEIPETMPAHDVTVTGTFSINSYNLTYMIDDKVYKEIMYEYGATITPEPQPEGVYATFEWIDLPLTMPAHDVVVYASYTSGIIEILMTTQRSVYIYSPNGKKLDKLQKGLNIVVLDDGTVKKIVVK